MKTLENKLSELFKAAEYNGDFDNRSFDVKALNKAIAAGLSIQIIKNGYIRETNNGFKWNVRLSIGSKGMVYRFKNGVTPYDILHSLAKCIQNDYFNLKINENYKIAEPCSKCSGRGIIPYFSYYCNGICFDCLGLGYKGYSTVRM